MLANAILLHCTIVLLIPIKNEQAKQIIYPVLFLSF